MNAASVAGPYAPWPDLLPRSTTFVVALWCRNVFFFTALLLGVVSLPRRPSLVGLSLTALYSAYVYYMFASY